MNLGMLDRFCPSLKTRALLDGRTSYRFDNNNDRYVIPIHRKNFWTNQWMQDPRKNFCRLDTMTLVRSTKEVGGHLKERED
jgi:hypothetical protein